MVLLENEYLLVEIATKGAELQKIYNKKEGFDYLWGGDPNVWSSHAPNLFPIIGRLNEHKHIKNSKTYELPQHGFVKISELEVTEKTDTKATFTLRANKETKAIYPYEFVYSVTYTLTDNKLETAYKVENHSEEMMPFSVGGHPGFNVPMNGEGTYEDYTITINPQKNVEFFEIGPAPFRKGGKKLFAAMKNGALPMSHEVFREGLIIIDEADIETVTLTSSKGKHGVSVHMTDFPYLCLWTKETIDAPFVCIEPFYGLPDIAGEIGSLEEKDGMICLQKSREKILKSTIEMF